MKLYGQVQKMFKHQLFSLSSISYHFISFENESFCFCSISILPIFNVLDYMCRVAIHLKVPFSTSREEGHTFIGMGAISSCSKEETEMKRRAIKITIVGIDWHAFNAPRIDLSDHSPHKEHTGFERSVLTPRTI